MFEIRKGSMSDCKDVLTIYQTTRWLSKQYETVEEVKDEHRGPFFKRWGWLVAEDDSRVVGEIIFRTEQNPSTGKIGIIDAIDVDIRYQKKAIGSKLVSAAEEILRGKKATRVVADSPPESYNFWMKIGYFARGSLVDLLIAPKEFNYLNVENLDSKVIDDIKRVPRSLKSSYLAHPGLISRIASRVIHCGEQGKIIEFSRDRRIAGVGVVVRQDRDCALMVVDVHPTAESSYPLIISETVKTISRWRIRTIKTTVPKDKTQLLLDIAPWEMEPSRTIPVTRLL